MSYILFFDTETTGLPEWKIPSEDPKQPHIVQLAAILADKETRKVVSSIDLIVRPDTWDIPQDMTEIHGISNEMARDVGVPEHIALDIFWSMWINGKHDRCCHNRTFDQRIIRIGLKRFFPGSCPLWADKENFHDTMLMSKPIMQLQPKGKYGYRNPKLENAYEFFIGKKMEGAHNAMNDVKACMELYFAMTIDEEDDPGF